MIPRDDEGEARFGISIKLDHKLPCFLLLILCCVVGQLTGDAQTWATVDNDNWSDAANWGGTLPANNGTANFVFSGTASPGKTHGTTDMDVNWNVNSIYWNSTSLDSGTADITNSAGTLTIQNGITNASGSGVVVIDPSIVLGAVQTWEDDANGTYAYGNISGPGGIIKTGTGTLTLGGSNSYTGGTTLSGWTLVVANDYALGTGTLNWAGGFLSTGGAGSRTLAIPMYFSAQYNYIYSPNAMTWTGPMDLGGHNTLLQNNDSGTTTITNAISDGGLLLAGGTWVLEGNNSFSGGLTIATNATVVASSDSNLGASTGVLNFNGGTLEITASISTNRPVSISSVGAIDTNGQTLNLESPVNWGSGTDLTVDGGGTLMITGTGNPQQFVINEATLEMLNTGTSSNAVADVGSGGVLRGVGSAGLADFAPGATLAPGISGSGSIIFNGDLLLTRGCILDFDLGASSSDSIIVDYGPGGSGIDLMGSGTSPVLVDITNAGGLAPGQTYTLMDWAGESADITGTDFQIENSPVQGTFSVSNDELQFQTVPEPSVALLLPALALLGFCKGFRSKRDF